MALFLQVNKLSNALDRTTGRFHGDLPALLGCRSHLALLHIDHACGGKSQRLEVSEVGVALNHLGFSMKNMNKQAIVPVVPIVTIGLPPLNLHQPKVNRAPKFRTKLEALGPWGWLAGSHGPVISDFSS